MRPIHAAAALALSCAASGAAQVHQIAFELDGNPTTGFIDMIDHAVAASATRVVVATNARMSLFSTAGGQPLEEWTVDDPDFPFQRVSSTVTFPFADPQVEYINGRFWLVYSERPGSYSHIAVSVSDSPDSFDPWDPQTEEGDWHFFTGSGASPAFDLQSSMILNPDLHFHGTVDHSALNVTGDYLYLNGYDAFADPEDADDAVIAFPLSHSGGSMLSGARPSESDLKILRLNNDTLVPVPDDGKYRLPAQSPHEVFTDVQLYVCTPNPPLPGSTLPVQYDDVQDGVRIGGAWVDAQGNLRYQWADLLMPSDTFHYFNVGVGGNHAETPDQTWEVKGIESWFTSAMLARTVNNEVRLFAAQHVLAADNDPMEPVDRHELRYYVIDPDLENFHTSWTPSIKVVGIAPAAQGEETYSGNIAVNAHGIAYITFTRSGPAQWPSLFYSRLTTDYTAVQFTSQIEQGPPQRWFEASIYTATHLSADYTDLQPAPNHCGFWSLAALVSCNGCGVNPMPDYSNFRAIWLTEIFACNTNAEMNGDGAVDEFDLLLYLDHYSTQEPQADMDGDGKTDSLDYLIYSEEYAKR